MDVGTVAKNKIKICGPEIGHKMNDKSHNFDLIIMELFEIGQLLPKYQLDYYVKLRIFKKKKLHQSLRLECLLCQSRLKLTSCFTSRPSTIVFRYDHE